MNTPYTSNALLEARIATLEARIRYLELQLYERGAAPNPAPNLPWTVTCSQLANSHSVPLGRGMHWVAGEPGSSATPPMDQMDYDPRN